LIQLFPPDDERLSLETCRGRKINTLKKVKKVRQVGCKSRTFTVFIMACDCALHSEVIQPSTPRSRHCLSLSGFPPGTVCAFSTPHASNTPRPSLSIHSFGKGTHETPRYEIFSIPLSTPHRPKHSS
jgi:hypothetical protein